MYMYSIPTWNMYMIILALDHTCTCKCSMYQLNCTEIKCTCTCVQPVFNTWNTASSPSKSSNVGFFLSLTPELPSYADLSLYVVTSYTMTNGCKKEKYHMYICTCICRGTYVHVMFEYTIYELNATCVATMYTCICVYHNKHNKVNSKLITCTLFW